MAQCGRAGTEQAGHGELVRSRTAASAGASRTGRLEPSGKKCYSTDMTIEPVQYRISGHNAATVARSIERGVRLGHLQPGDAVPSVRALAERLSLSPTTVAAAYRDLRQRGTLIAHDRSRTVIAHRRDLATRLAPEIPDGAVDLASGNPDPALLPDLGPALASVGPVHRLYGDDPAVERLLDLARQGFAADGIPAEHLAVVGGGLDGIERVLEVHCRLGDHIAIEDPSYIGTLDLVRTLGLIPVPVAIDDEGPEVDALTTALDQGVTAVLLVPRAQNPTGAALSRERAAALRSLLADHPEVLIVEDDHASFISGAPHHQLIGDRPRWTVVRSVAKSLGPDLRVAVLSGDDDTIARVAGRQRLGTGWVSHLLQHLTATVWSSSASDGTLEHATQTYAARRSAVLDAFRCRDITATGTSGFNVWVPVAEEVPVVQGMAARGWAVQAGEPFRLDAPPGLRITVAGLPVERAEDLAVDLAEVLDQRLGTRRG